LLNSLTDDPAIHAAISGFSDVVFSLALAGLAVAVGIAIWKYRLYDIDVIIRRTLIYSTLTVLLALAYWGGVAGLQAVLRPISGEGNDLAIVGTTLAVAALFLPLRRMVQRFIDRRFYRRKYDAERTLAEFAASLRTEFDLEEFQRGLLAVVERTMQPEHVSLWLRPVDAAPPPEVVPVPRVVGADPTTR
jgi:hypothetical protein